MKRAAKEPKSQIPAFKSYEEEAEFWDTHSPLDFPGEFEDVNDVIIVPDLATLSPAGRRRFIAGLGKLSTEERQAVLLYLLGLTEKEIERATRSRPASGKHRRSESIARSRRKIAPGA